MKIIAVSTLAAVGLLAALAYGDEPKKFRVALAPSTIGTTEIRGGEYSMLLHRDGAETKIQLTDLRSGTEFEVTGKVIAENEKFDRTEVHSREAGSVKQIVEIRLGGTNLKVDFRQGS